ncbi:hypothetical protein Trebr_1982 [Treponema brennaborense DSM 12168]|uniref:Uncharacterized protein n=2 Tax=Treponema TaxID=157 RepID=F4LJF3_TREBD|nr:hypothetical protein Trebr_1982 [Treponema brennaborense DSM 12168]
MKKREIDIKKYTGELLEGTKLAELMKYAGDIEGRGKNAGNVVKRGVERKETASEEYVKAKQVVEGIREELEESAGRLAAQQARKMLEKTRESYGERLEDENRGMEEWEETLALNNGYRVDGEIRREAIVGAVLFKAVRENQRMHRYEYYETALPEMNERLRDETIEKAEGIQVLLIIEQAQKQMKEWAERIFGKEEEGKVKEWKIPREVGEGKNKEEYGKAEQKNEEKLKRLEELKNKEYDKLSEKEREEYQKISESLVTVRDGELGEHIGYAAQLKSGENLDLSKSKESNVEAKGRGQMSYIMLDFQWNSMKARQGMAELGKPGYDKRLWDDSDSWLKAPTLREVTEIALEVVGSATGQQWWLGYVDDALFAGMDLGGGYKTVEQIGNELGKKALTQAVNRGVGNVTKWAGNAAGAALSKSGKAANIFAQAGISAAGSYAGSVANNYVNALDLSKLGTKEWMNWEAGNAGWTSAGSVSGALSAGIRSGMGGINLRDGNGITLNGNTFNTQCIAALNGLAGGVASSAVSFAMTGNATFNLASVKGVGLFELSVGKNGVSSKIGMGGMNVSVQNLMSAAGGAKEASKVSSWKYGKIETASTLNSINMLGYTKDIVNQNLANDIWKEKLNVSYGNTEGYGEYEIGSDTVTISDTLLGGGKDGSAKLGTVLSHEGTHYYGNRVEGVAHLQGLVTYTAINSLFGLSPDNKIVEEMAYSVGNIDNWVENTGDTDYWKMTHGGQLVNDGQGWLKDENGKYVSVDGSRHDKPRDDTLGGNGVETGLLNIINNTSGKAYAAFTDEEILVAQGLMTGVDMKPLNPNANFRDFKWSTAKGGQKIEMLNFMVASGLNVSDVIFNTYYNNTVDSQLAQAWGVDLGFTRDHEVPSILAEKYSNLVTQHIIDLKTPAGLENKYKFSVYGKDGVGTKLFNIDENNPFLDNLLKQGDAGLNSVINNWGCNFMTTIAYPQLLTGNIFDTGTITDIWNQATTSSFITHDTKELKYYVNSNNALVNQPDSLSSLVLKQIGYSNLGISIGRSSWWDNVNGEVIGNRIRVPYKPDHFTLGSVNNSILYNPAWSTGKPTAIEVLLYGK